MDGDGVQCGCCSTIRKTTGSSIFAKSASSATHLPLFCAYSGHHTRDHLHSLSTTWASPLPLGFCSTSKESRPHTTFHLLILWSHVHSLKLTPIPHTLLLPSSPLLSFFLPLSSSPRVLPLPPCTSSPPFSPLSSPQASSPSSWPCPARSWPLLGAAAARAPRRSRAWR